MEWRTTTQILRQLQAGEEGRAWERLFGHFWPVIVRFVRGMGLSPQDAEDAAQQTLLFFLQSLRQYRYGSQEGRFSHWLFGIARRVAL